MARRTAALLMSLVAGTAAVVVLGSRSAATASTAAEPGKIVFVNVGQGDGVVMKIGGAIVVSDVGEHNVESVDATLHDLRAKQIDVLILSHPHQDHVANVIALVEQYHWKIGLAVLSDSAYWHNKGLNGDIYELLEHQHVPIEIATRAERFDWGGADWLIVNPPKGEFTGGKAQAANSSIVYLLTYNGVTALFTGDVEAKVARTIAQELDPLLNDPIDIFLATHHGSKEGSVQELLDVIKPRWAVISSGPNTYGHPRPEAIHRLEAIGATIWCTDVNGSITARISAAGSLSWRTSPQHAPWWSGRDKKENGSCVGR